MVVWTSFSALALEKPMCTPVSIMLSMNMNE